MRAVCENSIGDKARQMKTKVNKCEWEKIGHPKSGPSNRG